MKDHTQFKFLDFCAKAIKMPKLFGFILNKMQWKVFLKGQITLEMWRINAKQHVAENSLAIAYLFPGPDQLPCLICEAWLV